MVAGSLYLTIHPDSYAGQLKPAPPPTCPSAPIATPGSLSRHLLGLGYAFSLGFAVWMGTVQGARLWLMWRSAGGGGLMLCGGAVVWMCVPYCSGPGGCWVARELPKAVVSPCYLSRVRWRRFGLCLDGLRSLYSPPLVRTVAW